MKKLFDKTFFLYVALGFLNYFFCSAVMLIFRNVLHFGETACLIIAFALQTTVSFVLNRFVTFRGIRISKWWPLKFVISIGVCYLGAKVLLKDLLHWLMTLEFFQNATLWMFEILERMFHFSSYTVEKFRDNLVLLSCTFIYCVINYVGQRYFVFKPVKAETPAETETTPPEPEAE